MSFWRDLEDLSQNDKLKEMRNYYHKLFLNVWWNSFFSFYALFLIMWVLSVFLHMQLYVMLAPLCWLTVLVITDLFIQMYNEIIEYVLMIILIALGVFLAYEGWMYTKYQFHEIWLIFYWLFLIISISCWFHWKRMVILYGAFK